MSEAQAELVRRSEALGLHPKNLRDVIDAINQHRNPMFALTLAASHREAIEQATAYLVTQCKDVGYSWAQIGHALGMTKQGAQQRYGPVIKP